ncbi:MAG: zinc metallopeptidase [Clostridium sp.]|jgi:Zn-dependent membrane protease YugP|uniref:zinc metallopeptidase n=1 Tax=Clostridium sp. TaxID=1506 RepID=UPI0025B98A52|nr:zinc metallopeptidase [Clostridium sp.]MCH3964040.1 zinc metallopeptidase [Clostridium sp.]MCI1716241.1 zinc metallopeptidase [Clostridium sp.]MCI1800519.1 zinc metallopeptidase [Clostridium sp.]MCI1814418.1 zinc metallopeptidase [Clostridium sp.]MCI1871317.1 zinc metallopeptidase [Clostridium sp.]
MLFFDSSFIILIPALLVAAYAQYKVSATFNKYSGYRSRNGYTGAQVARSLLDSSGLYDIPVEVIPGRLTDHYDPGKRVMRLSQDVYYGNSVASIGVAAHETGHAIQHQNRYIPLIIRNSIVPIASFGSNASWILFILGFMFGIRGLVDLGIILFTAVVLFQIVTLPVELNASRRALRILDSKAILYGDELDGARSVLSAAAMTYVAAALTAIANLLRLIFISRDRN